MIMLRTMGHLRPNLSPARPKNAAPTDRRSSVNVMAVEMDVLLLSKYAASLVVWMERAWKSNASAVQAKKPTRK